MMMQWPQPDPLRHEEVAKLRIKEEERKRDLNLSLGDTSNTSQSRGLSRRAFVLLQLAVLLLIIVGVVVVYQFLH
jgi:hypothetical protein